MVFEEPKVEFTKIDMSLATTTSTACTNPEVAYFYETAPAVESCNGPEAPMNNCAKYVKDGFVFPI